MKKKYRVGAAVIVALVSMLLVTAVIVALDEPTGIQRVSMTPPLQSDPPFGDTADWVITSTTNKNIGRILDGVGDVNGDGFDDFAYANWATSAVDLHYGSIDGLLSASNYSLNFANPKITPGGDFNHDGYDDFLITNGYAPVYVYYGSSAGPTTSISYTMAADPYAGNRLDKSTGIGDYNGDGFDDFLLVDYDYDTNPHPSFELQGSAWVFLGTSSGISTTEFMQIKGQISSGRLGQAAAPLGDINGDGYDDFALQEQKPYESPPVSILKVFYGREVPSANPSADWSWTMTSNSSKVSISGGDINADGYADMIVGEQFYTNGEISEGRFVSFYGSENGFNSAPDWSYESNVAYSKFGQYIDIAGDINDDGYDDVIVGTYSYDDPNAAYLFLGSSIGIEVQPSWTYTRQVPYALSYSGYPSFGIGDVNGDGAGDIAIGYPYYDAVPPIGVDPKDHGAIFAFYGTPSEVVLPEAITGLAIVRVGDTLTATHDTGGDLTYIWDYSLKSMTCNGDNTISIVPSCPAEMWVSLTATNDAYTETVTSVYAADLSLTP